jgi:TetR/AcrR family transcriptional repressor of nem operon
MGRPRDFETDVVVRRAMETFWTNGYANTSPAALAEATGVGKGSLYNAFGSKRELFERALECYDRSGAEFAEDLLAAPGTTRECIRAFLRGSVDSDLAQPVRRGCLVVNTAIEMAGHDPEIGRMVRRAVDAVLATVEARIARGQLDGDISSDIDPHVTAEFLMNTLAGLRVMARTHESEAMHRVIDVALSVLRSP